MHDTEVKTTVCPPQVDIKHDRQLARLQRLAAVEPEAILGVLEFWLRPQGETRVEQ